MKRLKLATGIVLAVLVAFVVAGIVVLMQLDLEDYREEIQDRIQEATGRKAVLDGPMELSMGLSPSVRVEQVRLANTEWGSQPDMADIKRFELELALWPLISGEIHVNRVVLVEPTIRLERNTEGEANWQFGAADDADTRDGRRVRLPDVRSLRVENARIVYRDHAREGDVQVALESARARAKDGGRLDVDITGGYQAIPFTLTGEIGDPRLLMMGTGAYPLDVAVEGRDLRAALSGTVTQEGPELRPDLRLSASGEELAALRPILGPDTPALGPFSFQGHLTREGDVYELRGIEAELAGSDLSGVVMYRPGETPKISGRLMSAVMDLSALLEDAFDDGPRDMVFPDTPFSLDVLHAADADLDVRVGSLRLDRGLSLSEVDARLSLAGGKLSLSPLTARFTDGPLTLHATVDAGRTPTRVAFDLVAQRLDYGRLLSVLEITDTVSGQLRARVDLRGEGDSPRALASSVGGDVELVGEEGRVADRLLRAASADVARVLTPWTESSDDVRLNCIVARFDVADGVMHSRAILADTQTATLGGEGRIDLKNERFDLRILPEAKQASLMSLAVPMRVSGPLDDPQLGPDPLGTVRAGAIAFGTFVNPLATVAALIVESQTRDRNPCVTALDRIADQPADGGNRGDSGGLGGFIQGLGESIQRQFGGDGDVGQDDTSILQQRHSPTGP